MFRQVLYVILMLMIHCLHSMDHTFSNGVVITDIQKGKLDEINTGHDAGKYGYVEKLYKITKSDIELLMPIKDALTKSTYGSLQIGFSYDPLTKSEKIKDKLLLAIPLFITTAIIPRLTYDIVNKNEKIGKILGGAISYTAGFATGNYLFPFLDSYHSHFSVLQKQFGPVHKTIYKKEGSFAILALFHYILHVIVQKLLLFPDVSNKIIIYLLQATRIVSYLAGVFDMRLYLLSCGFIPFLFALLFDLKKYDHPLERKTKDGKQYTLIDLLNAHDKH